MSDEDAADAEGIAGLPIEAAVDAVVARDDALDRDAARSALGHATEDGVVTWDGVDEALSELSTYVTTAEARVDLASNEFENARAVAAPVADLDAVAARLEEFESRLHSVEDRAADLDADLQALLDRRDDADLFEVATAINRIRADAAGVQGTADEIHVDIDAFTHWVADPDARYREFEADVDALGDWIDDLADAVEFLASEEEPSAGEGEVDRGAVWFDAALHRRLLDLLLADLRAEFADVRALADRTEVEVVDDVDHEERLSVLGDRLDGLNERLSALDDRLDGLARPAWRERFDERLAAFDAALAEYEPPISWEDVQETFERHRPTGEGA